MDENNWIEFDDDYFENKERKVAKENINFSPIMCHPKWFFNNELESAETVQNQANFCYWTKDYSSASMLYQKAIDNYFQNSQFMKRNLLESIAHCHLQLGDLARAQDIAEECLSLSYTVELKSSALNLLSIIYKSKRLLNQQKSTLLQLISLHPQNYRIWMDLADCFSCLKKSNSKEEPLFEMMEAACLLRVSLLISAMKNNDSLSTLKMVEDKLSAMALPENFLSTGQRFFSRDLMEDCLAAKALDINNSVEIQDQESESKSCDDEISWFKWIHDFMK